MILIFIIFFVTKANAATNTYEFTVKGTRDYTKAYEVARLVNEERKKVGATELKIDQTLCEYAMRRAAELVVLYDTNHYRPNGELCHTILPNGIWSSMGENIVAYPTNAEWAMDAWMNSPGHKANILSESNRLWDTIGVGCFKAENGKYYWVQIFTKSTVQAVEPTQQNRWVEEVVEVKNGLLPFWDVKETDYFYEAVCYNASNQYILGFNANEFGPRVQMTRGMFVTILYRIAGIPELETIKTLPDVEKGAYYERAVNWALSAGIVNGFEDGTFRPNDNIRRQDIVVILRSYLRYKGVDVSIKNNGTFEQFADNAKVEDYAKESVKWAVENKVINGTTNNGKKYIEPLNSAIRADVACILYNYGI